MQKLFYLVFLALVLASGCVKQVDLPENDTLPSQVRSIAVLPVLAVAETASGSPQANQQLQSGVETLTQILGEYFADHPKIRLLSAEALESFTPGYSSNQAAQALFIGKALKSEAVMLWEVNRYRERSGSDYAVQSPASLAFVYRLVHTESGQTLCSGTFDETQQSATENLLALKTIASRGFKWITAADLAQEGVTKKLSSCTYLKEIEN